MASLTASRSVAIKMESEERVLLAVLSLVITPSRPVLGACGHGFKLDSQKVVHHRVAGP